MLFADLVGFTPLSEARDAEDVRDLLSRYFETCRALIARYGGTVEKFIGDAVMAVWGAPVTNEDDAERAVRAALDLVQAVATLGRQTGVPKLAARAAVLTGEAAVNVGAVGEGMVAGDLVNTASRLQSMAEAGGVLVGEETFHAAGGAVAFAEVGELAVKGKAEPVRAWRALRVVAQRRGVGRSERLEPPFVGRDEELRQLRDALHAMARERKARLVSITGVPGIGKSRLAWEFLKYVDGLAETVYWHQGRCPAYGEAVTFWALGEMVRMRAGMTETEDPAIADQKLSAAVTHFVSDPDERRWVQPRLAHLLGLAELPHGELGEREELFSAWRTFFERIADRGPTVMVFEDLQWADPGLIDFIESILEWSRTHPILVVTLSRPELTDRRPTWGAGQRSFTALHLEPLPEPPMRALLAGLVRDLPPELIERLLARAEGVPLYAVETVRMLLDRGALAEREGRYEVAHELADLEIPGSLHALIASRLDGLPAGERALLQDAAVLGKTFTVPLLAAVTGAEHAALESQLRDLVRKELLALDSDPRSPERGQYGFVQALIREVAYGTLSRRDRRTKHLAAAHQFESTGDDELAGVVATHYMEAYRASPPGPESDAVAARARDSLSQAGQRALSLGSPEQALSYAEQALGIATDGADRTSLLELAGMAADRSSEHERAAGYLEEAIAYHQRTGDQVAAARATAALTEALGFGLNRFTAAAQRAEQAFIALADVPDDALRARLAVAVSSCYGLSGSLPRALEWSEAALGYAERLDDAEMLCRALRSRAGALFGLGRHREAAVLARGVSTIAAATCSLNEQAEALAHESVFFQDDDVRGAWNAARRGAELAKRAGYRGLENMHLLNAAELALFLGEWDDAREMLGEATHRHLSADQTVWMVHCEALRRALVGDSPAAAELLRGLADTSLATEFVAANTTYLRVRAVIALAGGDLDEAQRQAAAAVSADPEGINSPIALAIQARAALWQRDPTGARSAVAGMAGFHGRWMSAARLTSQAGLAALEGRTGEAASGYRQAVEAWRGLDVPLDLALCQLDQVVLLGPAQQAAASEAGEIFARIGATPFLQRLDQAVGQHLPA